MKAGLWISDFGFGIESSVNGHQSPIRLRRAFVIIAVLVIVGGALFVATGLLFQAQADVASSSRAADTAQARALAWSGLQAVMAEINDQRQRILEGELPRVENQYVIYETPARLGIVRLLPLGPADEQLVPEAGKIDLNSIDAVALENTGLVDSATAAAIIQFRALQPGGRFQSVADLLRTPGAAVTAEMLFGPIGEITMRDEAAAASDDAGARIAARLQEPHVRGLDDVLTVFAIEPSLQTNGVRRINLNVAWSDDLARKVESRFGPEAAGVLKQVFESGAKFENESAVFRTLQQYKTPPENWPQIIDAFTTEDGAYHMGRLDINSATYEALRGLPGVTPEQAAQIVRVREELSSDERRTIAWPAIVQVLPAESYDVLAGHVTTRSWTFRVRLAAGEVSSEQPESPIAGRVLYEAVLDFSAPKPRVAYLRDITALESAAQMAASAAARHAAEFASRDSNKGESPIVDDAEVEEEPPASLPDNEPMSNDVDNSPRSRATTRDSMNDESTVQSKESETKSASSPDNAHRIGRWRRGDG